MLHLLNYVCGQPWVSMGSLNVDPNVGFSLAKAFVKSHSTSMPLSNCPPTPCEVEHLSAVAVVGKITTATHSLSKVSWSPSPFQTWYNGCLPYCIKCVWTVVMDTHCLHPQHFELGQIIMVMPLKWASCCSRHHNWSSIWIWSWWDNDNIVGYRMSAYPTTSMQSVYCQCHLTTTYSLASMRSI